MAEPALVVPVFQFNKNKVIVISEKTVATVIHVAIGTQGSNAVVYGVKRCCFAIDISYICNPLFDMCYVNVGWGFVLIIANTEVYRVGCLCVLTIKEIYLHRSSSSNSSVNFSLLPARLSLR